MIRFLWPLSFAAFIAQFIVFTSTAQAELSANDKILEMHVEALFTHGQEPLDFVLDALTTNDLILFDDSLHNAVEPWTFYNTMIRSPRFREKARYIFLEVIPVNRQASLDAYFSTFPEDKTLLYPAFQDGFGWPYKTYFDFLHEAYEINAGLEPEKRLIIRAVSTPSYWKEMKTNEDWTIYNDRSVLGRDYDMYKIILADLQEFSDQEKGVFMTNTRHAYTNIRKPDGAPFWNTGTFFRQWHPGKTFSIRFNAPILKIEGKRPADESVARTAQGIESYDFSWARVANGLWDNAFSDYGGHPVAIDLPGTPFGAASYMGNHMHRAAPNQTMSDAYDGVIFLQPFENQYSSAKVDFIYTPAFKKELARRYRITRTPQQLETMLASANAQSLVSFIDSEHTDAPKILSPQAQGAGPLDAWRQD